MNKSTQEQYADNFLACVADGDVKRVEFALKVLPDLNAKNEKGWTGLMLAARVGHRQIIELLLDKGCDLSAINNSGQTALDIARFWNHQDIVRLLDPSLQKPESGLAPDPGVLPVAAASQANYFCSNPLDRIAHKRKDPEWLASRVQDPRSVFILFSEDLNVVGIPMPDHTPTNKMARYQLLKARGDAIQDILARDPLLVLLGSTSLQPAGHSLPVSSGSSPGKNPGQRPKDGDGVWFAMCVPGLSEERIRQLSPHAQLLNTYPAGLQLLEREAGVFAQARSLLAWHDRYRYCPTCGQTTKAEEAGYKRECTNAECRSLKGIHNTSYPRTDPTVIMAVVSPDGRELLLGRGNRHPQGMYSCLAGFLEPGEGIEDACRREVLEEAGILIGRVEYHSCQPWPMPSSLMIGCLAYATNTKIQIDKEELQDARWFTRQDVIQMLNHSHPRHIYVPPEAAIAHQLIKTWVTRTANL